MDVSDNRSSNKQEEEQIPTTFWERLGRGPRPVASAETDQPQAEPEIPAEKIYHPYGLAVEGREEEGLTFYHADGLISVKFYISLGDIMCPYPYDYLTLVFMDCVYTLKGRGLEELIPLIKRRKLDTLWCYDRTRFVEPLNSAVIYSINRDTHEDIAEMLAT